MATAKPSPMHAFRNKLSKGLGGGGGRERSSSRGRAREGPSSSLTQDNLNHHNSSHDRHGNSSHSSSLNLGDRAGHHSSGGHGHHSSGGGGGSRSQREQPGGSGGGGHPHRAQDDMMMVDGRSNSSSLAAKAGSFMRKKGGTSSSNNNATSDRTQPSPSSSGAATGSSGGRRGSSSGLGGSAGRKKGGGTNRRAIKASVVALESDIQSYEPPVIPKSDVARRSIYHAIKPNVLFRACSSEELGDLVDAFSAKRRKGGSVVIREGDHGDGFYVLAAGSVSVYESTEFKGTLRPGMGFGEIALLYSCPRTATVRAEEGGCDLWFIDRRAFRAIVARHKKRRLEMKLMLLQKVKIHDKTLGEILKPPELHSVAMAASFQEYSPGQVIVRQGDVGDAFYMIERGLVDVYVREKSDTHPVVTLQAGDFFGEKALLNSDVRTATCVAATSGGEVRCLLLMREDFVRMLGDLEYLLERSYNFREDHSDKQGRDGMGLVFVTRGGDPGKSGEVHPSGDEFVKSHFDIKRTLGVGAYGYVKLVRWNRAPPDQREIFYALKCVSKEKIEEKKQQHKIKREEDIMRSLVHPFVARCYTVMEDVKGKYFLMEALCGGELCELLYFESKFSEEWSAFYSASVLAAFAHMHERKVAYRDLKPENLVLDSAGYVKIVDFGLAKVIKGGQTYTFCGTPDYLAPEVILSEGHDWAVDYWGLGVLIYEMMEGVAPFYAENPMDTYRKALSGQIHMPDHFTVVVANLIKKLLHTDQSKRLGRTVGGTTAIMCHRWFANFDWDALLDYRMEAPYIPEEKDPDHYSNASMDGEVEGFASDFL